MHVASSGLNGREPASFLPKVFQLAVRSSKNFMICLPIVQQNPSIGTDQPNLDPSDIVFNPCYIELFNSPFEEINSFLRFGIGDNAIFSWIAP